MKDNTVALALECSRVDDARYMKIHKAGCRDLRDPERMKAVPTVEGLWNAFDGFTDWHDWYGDAEEAREEILRDLAPCARKLMREE